MWRGEPDSESGRRDDLAGRSHQAGNVLIMPFTLTRRTLLAAASALFGAGAFGGRRALAFSGAPAELPAGQNLLALLRHHYSAGEVGRAYLAIAPEEANPTML